MDMAVVAIITTGIPLGAEAMPPAGDMGVNPCSSLLWKKE